ncbi:bifunctional 2-polyprenyl-6-hydroxyphenol methylase/3-demethylubiquinol 3-O-methyltransferase UbiG [Comamonas sp. B-9]|uniref:class I SAM-dependent methyltransferase n=1 Tax=Comamonas sp. B-9 TaxID=1055192 RepID=UPI000395C1D8|nr:class I SAM-dependent methyltransferase [Comamonas sp. B-9]
MSVAGFYRAFEDRHRGSRELIRERLQVYLPYIKPLLALHPPAAALDLGCGRGEWLEWLGQLGFQAHGVDLDAGMLEACVSLGLSVSQRSALVQLADQESESLSIVSGFHIAEHLEFADLEKLVMEAMRVLKPGGLLILETPNPENLVVGSCNFYMDPTHQRPIPPLLLSFLAEHQNFARVGTLRLQESPSLYAQRDIGLMDVLGGASPDYAIVAQKHAAPEAMAGFDAVFEASYGLQIHQLAQRYDSKLTELSQRIASTEMQLISLSRLSECVEEKMQLAAALEADNAALRSSWSWRLTAPLRCAMGGLVGIRQGLQEPDAGSKVQPSIVWMMAQVLRHPRLSNLINIGLIRFAPGLHARLLAVGRNHGMVEQSEAAQQEPAMTWAELTPQARRIYTDLNLDTEPRQDSKGGPHADRH